MHGHRSAGRVQTRAGRETASMQAADRHQIIVVFLVPAIGTVAIAAVARLL